MKHICILGSTGSIGTSTLSIVERYPERFAVASLAAGKNVDLAFMQCQRWRPLVVSVASEPPAADLASRLKAAGLTGIEVVYGSGESRLVELIVVGIDAQHASGAAALHLHGVKSGVATDVENRAAG